MSKSLAQWQEIYIETLDYDIGNDYNAKFNLSKRDYKLDIEKWWYGQGAEKWVLMVRNVYAGRRVYQCSWRDSSLRRRWLGIQMWI